MNEAIFRAINGLAGRFGWLDAVMIFCARYLMYALILGVAFELLRNYKRWRNMAVVSISSALIARFGVIPVIRWFYSELRPYQVLSQVNLLVAKEVEASFPSGHTVFSFALATGVYLYNKKAGWYYLFLAALIGFARVFTGVHWPYDIIGGMVIGVGTALVCDRLYRKYKNRRGL